MCLKIFVLSFLIGIITEYLILPNLKFKPSTTDSFSTTIKGFIWSLIIMIPPLFYYPTSGLEVICCAVLNTCIYSVMYDIYQSYNMTDWFKLLFNTLQIILMLIIVI